MAIRKQWLIGLQPQNLNPSGKGHGAKVRFDRDRLSIYARAGSIPADTRSAPGAARTEEKAWE